MVKPFFKWPGSKYWLINRLHNFLPSNISRVVEPFAGSASFFLGSPYNSGFLCDANPHIVDCLTAVRDNPDGVICLLSQLSNTNIDYNNVKAYVPRNKVEAAARMVFLTNTSWGGLYRENKSGAFNVPFGNNGRSFFCEQTIFSASTKLKNCEIVHSNFDTTLENSAKGDLVFVDAPYVTKIRAEYFDRYHSSGYDWSDQLVLAKLLRSRELKTRKVLITCAVDSNLYELFPGWGIIEFSKRNSMTAYKSNTGNRKEALLLSPALSGMFQELYENI